MKTILGVFLMGTVNLVMAAGVISEEPSILTSQGVEVKVSKFCIAGDKVETKLPVEYCSKRERVWVQDFGSRRRSDGHFEYQCIATKYEKLSHPIKYMKAKCKRELIRDNGGDRYLGPCKYTYSPATLATNYTFPVYKITGRRTDADTMTGQGVRLLYKKTVSMKNCQ